MSNFILFSTEGCHLCELAQQLLREQHLAYDLVDIIDDEDWTERYKYSIPVLRHSPSNKELNWPFDVSQLKQFLENVIGVS